MLRVKVKRMHPDSVLPQYAKEGDAGMDLVAVSQFYDDQGNIVYDTGLAFEIPVGHVGLIFPRSSVSKYTLALANAVGVIDCGYRGSVMLKYKPVPHYHNKVNKEQAYEVGDKIGQIMIMPYPYIMFEEAEELTETERGEGGYGSTGN